MMLDHRYDNVRVSYIMPGSVDTDFGARPAAAPWKIQPEDVAEVVIDAVAYARAYAGQPSGNTAFEASEVMRKH